MTRRLFLDTTVLVHAAGGEHALRDPCRALIEQAQQGAIELHASVEVIQEFLYHRMRRADRAEAVAQAREASVFCRLHPFTLEVLERSIALVEDAGLRGRDAVHLATALEHGFDAIVSADRDFDCFPDVKRIDPVALI